MTRFLLVPLLFVSRLALAAGLDEGATKRKEVFEFTEKPRITREGDKVTVAFAVRDFCDVTVVVEDEEGKIVRHLAAGVLGPNAPAPLQKNSLKQTVVWDGKNDKEEYVDDKDSHAVRVSLGLKPQFERTLYWSPKKRTRDPNYLDSNLLFAAAPEGVYIYDGGAGDHLYLFDHAGNYVRSVYPPPAGKLKDFLGLKMRKFPQDGREWPLKWGLTQSTFLTTGNLGSGGDHWPTGGGNDVRAMTVQGSRLILAEQRINRLATDGGTGGAPLQGPDVFVPTFVPGVHEWRGGVVNVPPSDLAISPDGKWIYLAGYMWSRSWMHGALNGVGRIPADGDGAIENFVGSLGEVTGSGRVEKSFTDAVKGNPLAPGQFAAAASVAVDAQGRVYVADHAKDHIRVFDPAGKPLKDIPIEKPALVRVSPKNGEIYVFQYALPLEHWKESSSKPSMTKLASFDDPKVVAAYPLPTSNWRLDSPPCRIAVDFWTDPPRIWFGDKARHDYSAGGPSRFEETCARILVEKDRQLVVQRDFGKDAKSEVTFLRGPRHMKQRLYFDPKNRRLYVGELHGPWPFHVTSMHDVAVVNPDTGKVQVTKLPFDAEDMAFDIDGLVYLRTADCIARYDPVMWREVPFDYGEELRGVSTCELPHASAKVNSGVTFAGVLGIASGQMGGMGVSPLGHLAISVCNPAQLPDLKGEKSMHLATTKKYTPPIYPGRSRPWEIHVFDRRGKLVFADAVPGIGRMVGVNIDRRDDLYVMLAGVGRVNGQTYFNPITCSLLKLRPGTKILATDAVVPLAENARPKRAPDCVSVDTGGSVWVDDGGYWVRGGVAADGKRLKCHCASQSRPALDYLSRSFLPEMDRYSVLVVDANNNEIVRVGQYGNVDEGMPLVKDGGPPNPRSIGGDEVGLMHPQMLAVESDRRLFIGDLGNARIASVKLGYHAEEKIALQDVPDRKK